MPWQVGTSNLHYFIRPTSDQYFLQIVVSNGRYVAPHGVLLIIMEYCDRHHALHRECQLMQRAACRVPVAAVEMQLGGNWVMLQRATNNMFTLNSPGYQLPMPIRITPSCGNPVRPYFVCQFDSPWVLNRGTAQRWEDKASTLLPAR